MARNANDMRWSYDSDSSSRKVRQCSRTSSVVLSRHRRHTVATVLRFRQNCERCRNGELAPFETLPEDVLNIVARFANANDIFSLVQVSHTLALTLISRNAPRDSQLQSALRTARVHLNQPLATWIRYMVNLTGLQNTHMLKVVTDEQIFKARLRNIANIKSNRPSTAQEWLYELVGCPSERDYSIRVGHEKQIRLATLSAVHTDLFDDIYEEVDYYDEDEIARQLMDVLKSHPNGIQMAIIVTQKRYKGRVTPQALLAAEKGDIELINRIAHEIDRDAAEGLLPHGSTRRNAVEWILAKAADHAVSAGHLDIAVTLSELYEEVFFEKELLALSITGTALIEFRFISAWKLACRSPTLDRVHLLAACLVPMSYCARIRADYMYMLVYYLVTNYRSLEVTTTIQSFFKTHAAMAVPVAFGRLVGQRTLFIGAVLAYMCVWAERVLGDYVVPSFPKSIRDMIGRQRNMDAPLQVCFLVLWGMWLGAHVNNSYFDWLWAQYYWSPTKIFGSFFRSFNASLSSNLMLYMIYDYDYFTRKFVELAGQITTGNAQSSWPPLVLMWGCAVFGFVLYEHIWPFSWAWQLIVVVGNGVGVLLRAMKGTDHDLDLTSASIGDEL